MKKILFAFIIISFLSVINFGQKYNPLKTDQRYILVGNGITDDTDALNAWGEGKPVIYKGRVLGKVLRDGRFLITWGIRFENPNLIIINNTFIKGEYRGYDSLDLIFFSRGVLHYGNVVHTGYTQIKDGQRYRRKKQNYIIKA